MPEPMNTIELILGPAPRVLSPDRAGHAMLFDVAAGQSASPARGEAS